MNDHKETNLRDILSVVFRHKLVIFVCFITIMTAVYVALNLRTLKAVAAVKILVSGKMQKDLEVERHLGAGSLTEIQMELVRSGPILRRVVEALKLYERPLDYEKRFTTKLKAASIDFMNKQTNLKLQNMTPDEKRSFLFNNAMANLAGNINTYPHGDTSIFTLSVKDFNPATAVKIANVLSRSYVIFDLEQQIAGLQLTYGSKNDTIIKLNNYIKKMEETLDGRILPDNEALGPASVKIINQAHSGALMRLRPSLQGGLMSGFFISMVMGVVLAFSFEYFDQTFRTPGDVKKYLGIPLLGSIPKRKARDNILIRHTNPVTRYTQSIQSVSNQIYVVMKEKNLKSLILSDAESSEKIATMIADIGACLSHIAGYKVLIIDADLRTASVSKVFNLTEVVGLQNLLETKISFEDAIRDIGSDMTIIPAGEIVLNPIALLESSEMSDIIKKTQETYDIVLINCGDMKNYSDAFILSSYADSIAIVIKEGMVRRHIIKNAIAPLYQTKVNIIGGILSNRKDVIPEIIYRLT